MEVVADLVLVAAVAEDMPRLLAAAAWPADASPVPMIEHLLHGSPVSAAGIDLVCAALGEIAKGWPQGRRLRVLEIGGGGGAPPRPVRPLAPARVALRSPAPHPPPGQAAPPRLFRFALPRRPPRLR